MPQTMKWKEAALSSMAEHYRQIDTISHNPVGDPLDLEISGKPSLSTLYEISYGSPLAPEIPGKLVPSRTARDPVWWPTGSENVW